MVSAPAVFLPPQDGIGVQVVAAAPGGVNAQQAMILPPLSVDRAVFQPDQARAAGEYRPVLVDEHLLQLSLLWTWMLGGPLLVQRRLLLLCLSTSLIRMPSRSERSRCRSA